MAEVSSRLRAEPERRATDWVVRLVGAGGRSPIAVAVVLFLILLALSWGFRIGVDGYSLRELAASPFTYLDVLNAILSVYLALALLLLRRARLRDLEGLKPALGANPARYAELVSQVVDVPPRRLFRAGCIWAVLLSAMVLDPAFWQGNPPALVSLPMLFFALRSAATGWLVGHVLVTEVHAVSAFRRIGREEVRVDLFDLAPLAPFARSGFRSAMTWLVASSLTSLFWLGPAAGRANSLLVGGTLVSVVLALFVSISGVRANIRAAKQRALGDLRAAIRERGNRALRGDATATVPSVADLVALHGFFENVREWPLDAPALARAGLLAVVALGSWGGAALVEMAIDWVLRG